MVVEADESDRSFLKLSPSIAVITNIDREHMESYGSWENLQQAFVDFANKVPFYGAVVACADDAPVRELLPKLTRRVITYGLERSPAPTSSAAACGSKRSGLACDVLRRGADGVDDGARRAAAPRAGPSQPAERARRRRGRARSGRAVRADRRGARGVPAAPSAASRCAARTRA